MYEYLLFYLVIIASESTLEVTVGHLVHERRSLPPLGSGETEVFQCEPGQKHDQGDQGEKCPPPRVKSRFNNLCHEFPF